MNDEARPTDRLTTGLDRERHEMNERRERVFVSVVPWRGNGGMGVAESKGLKSLSEVESDPAGSAAPQGLNQRLRAFLSFSRRIHPSVCIRGIQ